MPVVERLLTHSNGVQATTTESRIVVAPSSCIAGHFSAELADWTEYHIHSVNNGVMIRLPSKKGGSGLSNSHDNRVSSGADTANQITTLTMVRNRHDRTGLPDGFCLPDGCGPAVDGLVPDVFSVGLVLVNGAAGSECCARVYARSGPQGSCVFQCVNRPQCLTRIGVYR